MRAVVQRVSQASVTIDGKIVSQINKGLLILLGVASEDDASQIEWLSGKIARMRIFEDAEGRMNESLLDQQGDVLVVSQFTLHASTKKGNRPSFIHAAPPNIAEPLYEQFCETMEGLISKPVGRGQFGAMMNVSLSNDGPVTIVIDSLNRE